MNTQQLKELVAAGGRQYKIFKDAEEALAKLEGFEQTLAETKARVEAIKAEESSWASRKAEALEDIEAAKKMADNILKAANESAASVTAAGIAKVDAERESIAQEKEAADEALKQLSEKIETAKLNLATMDSLNREAAAELKKLQDQKAAILAQFGK